MSNLTPCGRVHRFTVTENSKPAQIPRGELATPIYSNTGILVQDVGSAHPALRLSFSVSRTYSDFWDTYRKVFPENTHQSVGKESGQTNHIERWNNTLRQRLSRFVRKTLSFSKSDRFHEAALKLFIHRYNRLQMQAISQF